MAEITKARAETQPVNTRTGGSTFKNPPGHKAWELIDKAGCRGLALGDAQVSKLHCNFLINRGAATSADLEMLGEIVRTRVLETSGIALEWEILLEVSRGEPALGRTRLSARWQSNTSFRNRTPRPKDRGSTTFDGSGATIGASCFGVVASGVAGLRRCGLRSDCLRCYGLRSSFLRRYGFRSGWLRRRGLMSGWLRRRRLRSNCLRRYGLRSGCLGRRRPQE